MTWFDKRTASVLITIGVFVAAAGFIYDARRVLIIFLLAILFAYLLEPLVSRFERWERISRGSRNLAILEVYAIFCAAIAITFIFLGPGIAGQLKNLAAALPSLFEKVTSGQIAIQIGSTHGWSYNTQMRLQQFLASHSGVIVGWIGSIGERMASLAQNAVWLVLIPILAVFFLRDGRVFMDDIFRMIEPRQQKRFLMGISNDLNEMLAHYIRMQLILMALSLAAYMSVLSILRVPYAAALGAIAGVLEFIPVVGPLVGAAAIVSVAFMAGYHHLVVVVVFLGIWRLVQDYVTTPHLMGEKLKLHPLVVIFAVLVGAEIGGVIGVYLSIPIAAALRIVWARWRRIFASEQHSVKAA